MNRLISSFRHWFVQNHSVVEASQKASASANDQTSTARMLTQLQQLCATLPQGQAEVLMHAGGVQMNLTWQPEEKVQGTPGRGFYFVLSGQSEEVEFCKVNLSQEESPSSETPSGDTKSVVLKLEEFKSGEANSADSNSVESKSADSKLEECKAAKPTKQQQALRKLMDFLRLHYAFRYNRLTDRTECAVLQADHLRYQPVDSRVLNSISLQAMQVGIPCWDRDVKRYVESSDVPDFHPFTAYMQQLPQWDGRDRITPLAQRVATGELWVQSFHRWMLGMTAQWMEASGKGDSGMVAGKRANSVAPVLVSTRQGMGKSTFCRMLLPDCLRMYFTESFDLTNPGGAENKLASFGLINLDEFDRLPASRMPQLKNLMQMECLNIRRAYKHSGEPLPRIASFIGTSNRRDLLTDLSGSRRFICVEVDKPIDCSTPIEYEQLYAQLKQELEQGVRCWFSKEEEGKIQQANRAFYRTTPAEELLEGAFCFAEPGEEGAHLLSAAQIYTQLKSKHPAALQDCTPLSFSKLLAQVGRRVHTRYGNGYWVKPARQPLL